MGLRSDKSIQSIAVENIAVFGALALADPKTYLGKTLELAGDELTEAQAAEVFTKVIGRPVTLVAPSTAEGQGPNEEMRAMLSFYNGQGYDADIAALRKIHTGLLSLEQYLRKNGWENAQPIPIPEGQAAWGS